MKPEVKHLIVKEGDGVIEITLNRPDHRNALNDILLTDLMRTLQWIEDSRNYRLMVLKGKGKVFCGGADLEWFRKRNELPMEKLVEDAGLFFDCYELLYKLSIPSICYAHGAVYGGATGLVAACDLSLANHETRFSLSEVRLGLVPATVAPFIIGRIGPQKARSLMLTGRVIDATEAERIGLVDYLCNEESAETCLQQQVNYFKRSGPEALINTKKLINNIVRPEITGDLRNMTTELLASVRKSGEAREGIEAFFEKRDPDWKI